MSNATEYAYSALSSDGRITKGTLYAASASDASAALDRQQLLTLELEPREKSAHRPTTISAADLGIGLRILSDLFDAGLPMTRALAALGDLAPPSWRPIIPQLRESVTHGKSFATALRDAPADIPALVIGMTFAGELSGDVAASVRRSAELIESVAATRAAIRGALAYPIVLALAGAGAIGIMVGVVIPRFAVILSDLGQALPTSTRFVMSAALFAQSAFVPFIVAATLTLALLRGWTSTTAGRARWHAILLNLPGIGSLRRSFATARSAHTLATLLESGVAIRPALSLAARASSDAAIQLRLNETILRIESGQTIATALQATDAFTPLGIRMVQAGEESGRLASMLRHAAKIEEQRADSRVRTAVRLLEPSLILIFSTIVAIIAAALLQAVYSVRAT